MVGLAGNRPASTYLAVRAKGKETQMDTKNRYLKWRYHKIRRRIVRAACGKLYRDSNGIIGNSIMVAGTGRSGTTWLASVIASEYREIKLIPPLAYGIAALTALSRVNDDFHWASDVFLGSSIGYFTGKAISHFHRDEENRFAILPMAGGGYSGLSIAYRY